MANTIWTRLSETVAPGATVLKLQDDVSGQWEAGQHIVIVTTKAADFDPDPHHENEVGTIASVSGSEVTLMAGVKHEHWAGDEYQGEVGLLSRTLSIEGDADSDNTMKGGHLMCLEGSMCRISYTHFYRMGQKNKIGRYPMHWHLAGDLAYQQYFRGNAIYKSFFRAVTIHGTQKATVDSNVAYDITGSGFYMEDGVEEDNVFSYNLIARVKSIDPPQYPYQYYDDIEDISDASSAASQWITPTAERAVPTDITAVGFYITNQKNVCRGNAASGGCAGFYFPGVPYVLGQSRVDAR